MLQIDPGKPGEHTSPAAQDILAAVSSPEEAVKAATKNGSGMRSHTRPPSRLKTSRGTTAPPATPRFIPECNFFHSIMSGLPSFERTSIQNKARLDGAQALCRRGSWSYVLCLGRCSRTCSANLAQHGVVWGGVLSAFLLVLFDLVYFRSSPLQPGSWLCADSVSVGCSFDLMSSVCWAVLCCHICLPTYMPCGWRNPIPTNPLSSVSFFERICVPSRRH